MASEDADLEALIGVKPRRSRLGCIGWILFLVLAAVTGVFIRFVFYPLKKSAGDLGARVAEVDSKLKDLENKLTEAKEAQTKVAGERDQLSTERQKAIDEKERALKELEQLKGDLTADLGAELESGDIKIQRRGRELVVDVSEKILFDVGKTEVNEHGKTVLEHVAKALAKFTKHVIQVGGHTDNTPVTSKDVQEKYPTNWELSTARATNVVRFFQEKGKIPGDRLMAAGFAEYRPVSPNNTEAGRRLNRRIEVVLLPREPPAP
jgi:chemotaxis protein MotB